MIGLSLRNYSAEYLHDYRERNQRIDEIAETFTEVNGMISALEAKTSTKINIPEMKDVQFLTAKEKQNLLQQWKNFVVSGFIPTKFTKGIYEHLHLHCGFIAHYDRSGFYYTYWNDEIGKHSLEKGYRPAPVPKAFYEWDRFLQCFSVWGDYADINLAMMIVLWDELVKLRDELIAEVKSIFRHEIATVNDCLARERDAVTQEIAELRGELLEKERALESLTLETYTKQLREDYEDQFGVQFQAFDIPLKLAM